MNVLGYEVIRRFTRKHRDSESALNAWYQIALKAAWTSLAEVRATYPHADLVGTCTVFNIGGNKYRLIAKIDYRSQVILIVEILTHAEYNKEKWKGRCKT